MPDFWDSPELARPSDFVTFTNPGDTVSGVVTALRIQTFVDGGMSKTVPQIDLDTPDGPRTLTAGQTRLQMELRERRPGVGDLLTVTMTGVQKRPGGKTLKEFTVTVGQSAADVAPAAAADETIPTGILDLL